MARLLGILLIVVGLYGTLYLANPMSLSGGNLHNVAATQGYFGILTLGAAILIISGGIDLSIGSVVALCAVLFSVFCKEFYMPPLAALACTLLVGVIIGLVHGVLVTWLKLQPFLVTLCGLFAYRGLARYFSGGKNVGFTGYRETLVEDSIAQKEFDIIQWVAEGNVSIPGGMVGLFDIDIPAVMVLLLVLVAVLGVFLHGTVMGRYLFAIGGNEEAARYAGVPTVRYKILAYVLCSTLAALGGVLEPLRTFSVTPSTSGSFYELYAITGAVLGGCGLSGGEGNIIGVLLGSCVLPILRNLPTWVPAIPDTLQPTIVGVVLLLGTITDQMFKRGAKK